MFCNDVPRRDHLWLVDKVVDDVPCGGQLVHGHATGHEAEGAVLLGEKGQVDEEPAGHGRPVREELDVDAHDKGVELGAHDKVVEKGSRLEPVGRAGEATLDEEVERKGEGKEVCKDEELRIVVGNPGGVGAAGGVGGGHGGDADQGDGEAVAFVGEAGAVGEGYAEVDRAGEDGAEGGKGGDVGEGGEADVRGGEGEGEAGEDGDEVFDDESGAQDPKGDVSVGPAHGGGGNGWSLWVEVEVEVEVEVVVVAGRGQRQRMTRGGSRIDYSSSRASRASCG